MAHLDEVRRIVTGDDAQGKSYFVPDQLVPKGMPLWGNGPDDPLGDHPGAPSLFLPSTAPHIEPPVGGSRFVQIALPPWTELKPRFENGAIPGHDAGGFHRTETVDYIFLLTGALEILLDDGARMLAPGDVVIQRNTLHSWRNHLDRPVDFLATMVRIQPR